MLLSSSKNFPKRQPPGFTLVELLVVIAIIGLLSAISIISLNNAREKALITRRLADMRQIQTALALYYDIYGQYPDSDLDGAGGWDIGNRNYQLLTNRLAGITDKAPNDSVMTGNNAGYAYYRYPAGGYGCDPARGAYYVLGIRYTGKSYPSSPGWACPSRNWQNELEWVTGSFEK